MSRYELKRTSDSQFLFNLKAANNEVILTSERYKQKASAENGIESVRTNSVLAERYDRRIAADGKPYFVLKAANGEIIGRSEMYNSSAAMENGIRSVTTNGPIAKLVDNTEAPPPAPRAPRAPKEQQAEQAASASSEPAPQPAPPAPPAPGPLFPPPGPTPPQPPRPAL